MIGTNFSDDVTIVHMTILLPHTLVSIRQLREPRAATAINMEVKWTIQCAAAAALRRRFRLVVKARVSMS